MFDYKDHADEAQIKLLIKKLLLLRVHERQRAFRGRTAGNTDSKNIPLFTASRSNRTYRLEARPISAALRERRIFCLLINLQTGRTPAHRLTGQPG